MNCIFITGTDTDAGKTIFSALLMKSLRSKGYNAVYAKPLQTGSDSFSDIRDVYSFAKHSIPDDPQINSYLFKKACSPHLSASLENKTIEIDKIINDLNFLKNNYDLTIIEGAGGLMVPLNDNETNIDLIKKLSCPVILVASNKLGMINHSLLSINTLKQNKVTIAGLVTIKTSSADIDQIILKDNPEIVSQLSGTTLLADIDYFPELSQAELSAKQSDRIIKALETN